MTAFQPIPAPRARFRAPLLAACLCACTTVPPLPQAPSPSDYTADVIRTAPDAAPPAQLIARTDLCFAQDASPAVIETVTEQVQASPERRAPDGSLLAPATWRSQTHTRLLRDRALLWFPAPCPDSLTPDFIASLQRALKARGYFLAPLTGQYDSATRDAVRRFQADRGLDSGKLALVAARDLGLLPASPGTP